MTEILLIIPPFCYGDLSEAGPVYPSMGIVCVAATLEHAGYKVKIIDMFAEGYEESKLKSCLEDPELKIVGVSSVSATFKISLNILKYAKEKRPDTTTIIGGPHITILPDETMKETYIDYGVLGEGDNTAVELADLIIKNKGSPVSSLKDLTRATVCFKPRKAPSPSDVPKITGDCISFAAKTIASSILKSEKLNWPIAHFSSSAFLKYFSRVILFDIGCWLNNSL